MTKVRLFCLIGLLLPPSLALFRVQFLPLLTLSVIASALAALLFFLACLASAAERGQGRAERSSKGSSPVRVLDLLWLALACWAALRATSLAGLGEGLRILGLGGVLLCMRGITVSARELRLVLRAGTAIGLAMMLLSAGFPSLREGVNGISTASAIVVFAFYPFALAATTRSKLERIVALLVFMSLGASLLLFRSRASVISLSVAITLGAALLFFRPAFKRRAVLLVVILACVLAPVVYMVVGNAHVVEDTLAGIRVREEIRLGKRVNTGRERLWPRVAQAIRQQPWIGWGTREGGFSQTGFHLSSHNSFLHAWLEWGVVGFALLALLCVWILGYLADRSTALGACAAAFFVAFLCRDSFEVALVQNNSPLALASWTVVGIGLLRVRHEGSTRDRGKHGGVNSRHSSQRLLDSDSKHMRAADQ